MTPQILSRLIAEVLQTIANGDAETQTIADVLNNAGLDADDLQISHVESYERAGMMTRDEGLVVHTRDTEAIDAPRRQIQVTIIDR